MTSINQRLQALEAALQPSGGRLVIAWASEADPDLYTIDDAPDPLPIEVIKARLDPNDTLIVVTYVTADDWSEGGNHES